MLKMKSRPITNNIQTFSKTIKLNPFYLKIFPKECCLVPALGLRLRVWMPFFFIANGRLTCQRIIQINFVRLATEDTDFVGFPFPPFE